MIINYDHTTFIVQAIGVGDGKVIYLCWTLF